MRIPGYEAIQELTRSDGYTLNRARSKNDRKSVLLKIPLRSPPTVGELDLLEHEFDVLREISTPGVPRAIEMRRDVGCLVVEDSAGAPLQSFLLRQRLSLNAFFKVGIQLCTILAELHRRNIIHRGINPRSIFVHPDTYETHVIDFSYATSAPGEAQPPVSQNLSRELLPYLSPEQTGRMNRSTDYRTDYYSLGVVFYEILTGACPFRSDDSLELINWHIARAAKPPAEINPDVPETVSRIVMKLLSKTAEQRYQSALGLREDLERCERERAAYGKISPFPIGQHDLSDRFLVPQKLYGREREVEEMLLAFERACEGPAAMMLVAGYSGIGKTSLIQELYKPIVRERGYFISGKFDQIARIPYGAFIQAFRALCRQLLSEGEDQLASWRERLTNALGAGGSVIAEVIPEIELIAGSQPPAPPLAPTEAQNRFRLVFQNFVGALASKEHPLVIFLDDLQWADSATLGLLQPLLTSRDVRYLFLIGAYRDNEVDAAHPLSRVLGNLEADGVRLHQVALGPLALDELALLIRDTLHRDLRDVEPLARLVLQKTEGNPFFVIQFLRALYHAGLIEFDYDHSRWIFHMEAIAGAGMMDNVIYLMTRRIRQLSSKAQAALMLAAYIGSQFDLGTLAIVSQQSVDAAAADLSEAISEGLILPTARSYDANAGDANQSQSQASPVFTFLHDRVQQAAYALIPGERKQLVHLTVGRLLLDRWETDATDEKGFDIVNHLNLGRSFVTDEQERLALARLNLDAGRRAKSSTAYEAALGYFNIGIALLTQERWETHYDLSYALHLEAAECEYLCGDFDAAEQKFILLLGRAATRLDKARVYLLRSVQCENLSRYSDALAIARAIHNRSARKDRPLVKVNCGAISAGLVESELFGHVKGAFTGAIERRVGRFELADRGTLFLDEVSELPLETQVKLLRVLQEQEFEPVGSSRTVRVDVRIIAATNRNLEEAVQSGRFRRDLFYRLNVFPLRVPSLRERQTDIPQLVIFFMHRFSKKFGKRIESVSQESMQLLMDYSWPGNVRELQNIIERAVVLSQGNVLSLGRNLFPSLEPGDRLAHTEVACMAALERSISGSDFDAWQQV